MDQLSEQIAARLRAEREARGWSLAGLADRSGVSKAMISKIERGESSPTTNVLGRLCGAFGLTLSSFLTRAEGRDGRLVRAADQPSWTDPKTGLNRRLITPSAGGPIELVEVELPPGAEIGFPASLYAVFRQLIWMREGKLVLIEGELTHELYPGDCLELGPPSDCLFRNGAAVPCRYIVAAGRRD